MKVAVWRLPVCRNSLLVAATVVWAIHPAARAEQSARPTGGGGTVFAPAEQRGRAASLAAEVTLHPRLLIQSDAVIARHGPDVPAIEDGNTHEGFFLRRARLGVDATDGVWSARLLAELAAQPEAADASDLGASQSTAAGRGPLDAFAGEAIGRTPRLTEAFVALSPHKALRLAGGMLRVPLGLSRQTDEADLRLPERARVVVRMTPDFRVGAAAGGDLGLLQYAFGAYSAAPDVGSSFKNGGVLYVLRLSGEPIGPVGLAPQLRRRDDPWYGWWRFSAGVSAFYAQLAGADEIGVGGDGQFQWRRLCVTGELLWARRARADRVGFSIEPGVFVWSDRMELVARAEWLNDEVGPRSPADAWGATLGATFLGFARHARLQVAYNLRRTIASDDHPTGWLLLRATFTF